MSWDEIWLLLQEKKGVMQIIDGVYQYSGGVKVQDIAAKYDCPLYVYDFDVVKRQYDRLVSAFEGIPLKIYIHLTVCPWRRWKLQLHLELRSM